MRKKLYDHTTSEGTNDLGIVLYSKFNLDSWIFDQISEIRSLVRSNPEIKAATISMVNTLFQLFVEMYPVRRGPIAAPTDPVPSIMAVTVARARELPFSELCVPRSAETAVVISAYGPLTSIPVTNIRPAFQHTEMLPNVRYRYNAGIAQYMKLAAMIARASKRSDIYPAITPPRTPPTSNKVDRVPADESDK